MNQPDMILIFQEFQQIQWVLNSFNIELSAWLWKTKSITYLQSVPIHLIEDLAQLQTNHLRTAGIMAPIIRGSDFWDFNDPNYQKRTNVNPGQPRLSCDCYHWSVLK